MELEFDLRTIIYFLIFLWPVISRLIQRNRQAEPEPDQPEEWEFKDAQPSVGPRRSADLDADADDRWTPEFDGEPLDEPWSDEPESDGSELEPRPADERRADQRWGKSLSQSEPSLFDEPRIEPGPFALAPAAESDVESAWGEADDEAWQQAIEAAKLRAIGADLARKSARARPPPAKSRGASGRRSELRDAIVLNAVFSPSRAHARAWISRPGNHAK